MDEKTTFEQIAIGERFTWRKMLWTKQEQPPHPYTRNAIGAEMCNFNEGVTIHPDSEVTCERTKAAGVRR